MTINLPSHLMPGTQHNLAMNDTHFIRLSTHLHRFQVVMDMFKANYYVRLKLTESFKTE